MARRSTKPYIGFAQVYDRIMADVPYGLWMDYIEGMWTVFSSRPAMVLDLACGTGNMSLLMARRGYQVTGLDVSPAMLEIAKQKLQREGLYATFIQGDMRDFRLEHPIDAAICVFDSINYLLEPEDVKSAFRSVAGALVPGGLFVFDANTQHRLAMIPRETHLFEGSGHYLVWKDLWDPRKKWWRVDLTGFVRVGGSRGNCWQRFDEVHRERAFPIEKMKSWLEEAGFEVKAVYDSCSFRPASEMTSRAYYVARKL